MLLRANAVEGQTAAAVWGRTAAVVGRKIAVAAEVQTIEVLFKGIGVKLGGQVLLGVEVGSVEHGSPGKQIGLRELPIKSLAK